ncbi:spore coat protein [Heliophilum fasciatum]|uniref:Coat F domain-containing protein n=1 Tax=Heliophilum fasciatum TaxID=35700 RepID=A0A4R2RNA8_9FIRM|nr:spore coat protein [Heliophilum fasciatum]MCW2277845.1 hypothetical protein [Heliophilum fasciatum]TCP64663.1 coat F domain-containing protein [Heliophilum fasciatum]
MSEGYRLRKAKPQQESQQSSPGQSPSASGDQSAQSQQNSGQSGQGGQSQPSSGQSLSPQPPVPVTLTPPQQPPMPFAYAMAPTPVQFAGTMSAQQPSVPTIYNGSLQPPYPAYTTPPQQMLSSACYPQSPQPSGYGTLAPQLAYEMATELPPVQQPSEAFLQQSPAGQPYPAFPQLHQQQLNPPPLQGAQPALFNTAATSSDQLLDRDLFFDAFLSLRSLSDQLHQALLQSGSSRLHEDLLTCLQEVYLHQHEMSTLLQQRGWYSQPPADPFAVRQAGAHFMRLSPSSVSPSSPSVH